MAYFIFKWKKAPIYPAASWSERWQRTLYAIPALSIPTIILGGIYSGIMTPIEAAAASVFITIPVSIIYKSFSLKATILAMEKAMVTTSMVYFILGGTILFINVLTFAEVPQYLIAIVEKMQLGQNALISIMLVLLFILDIMMEPVPMLF